MIAAVKKNLGTKLVPLEWREVIIKNCQDLHNTLNLQDYIQKRDQIVANWKSDSRLDKFTAYFINE